MDIDFEKTMAMLSGESSENIELMQLTDMDRIQITNALDTIFQGLSLRNWLAGGVLRDAWQNALNQLRDYVFAIPVNNAATMFARQVVFDMRTTWDEKMRTAPRTNMPIQCPADKKSEWERNADTKIQNGTDLLMQKINNFVPGTPNSLKSATSQTISPTFQNLFDSRIDHERQNIHERTL